MSGHGEERTDEDALGLAETRPLVDDPRDGSTNESMARATVRAALFQSTPPPRLGRYEIINELGRGGLGIVYRARDPELAREVALKVLRRTARDDPQGRASVTREGRALAALAHPNVVHVYEIGEADAQVFVVMELVPGRTLGAWLGETERSWTEIVEMFLGAGEGLLAAHAAGLVHRDFKLDNVLVGNDGRPRVVDFGLARDGSGGELQPVDDLDDPAVTSAGVIVGTPAYMSPEVMTGVAADERSDQFSFCVALFEALYGRRPFAGGTFDELRRAVLTGEPDMPEGTAVPRAVQDIVLQGLRRAPRQRHESMSGLLAALRAQLAPRDSRTRTIVLAAGAVAVLAAAAVLATRPDAPGERATTEPWIPAFVALTKSAGTSLTAATIDRAGERLAYVAADGTWLRDVAGGAPRRLELSHTPQGQLSFGHDGQLWLTDNGILWRVDLATKAETRLVDGVTSAAFLAIADNGTAVGVTIGQWWRFDPGASAVRSWPLAGHPSGLAVSPDGTRVAVRSWPRGAEHEDVQVFDEHGAIVSEGQLDPSGHEGLAWVGADRLVAPGGTEETITARCLTIRGDTVELLQTSEPTAIASGMTRAVAATDAGSLLLSASATERDVMVGRLQGDRVVDLSRLAPDVDYGNSMPAWLDAERLAYVSRQHLRPTTVIYDMAQRRASGSVETADGVMWAIHTGDGAILELAEATDGSLAVARVDDTPQAPRVAIDDSNPKDPLLHASCRAGVGCVLLRRSEAGPRFDALAPGGKRIEPGVTCPVEILCMEARVSLASDGRVLVPTADRQGLSWVDPRGGAVERTAWSAPEGSFVQSAIALPDGTSAIVTLIFDDGEHDPYAMARLSTNAPPVLLWQSRDTWVVNPALAPDGIGIAVAAIQMRTNAALLTDALVGCRPAL